MNNATKIVAAVITVGLLSAPYYLRRHRDKQIKSPEPSNLAAGSTIINFSNPWHTLQTNGSYSGTPTTFNGFTFTGDDTSAALTGPDTALWTFILGSVSYSSDLPNLTSGHTSAGSMSFTGEGIAHIMGFDDTIATFSFQDAGSNFGFQLANSTTSAVTISDNGPAIALFATAIIGIVILRRKVAA